MLRAEQNLNIDATKEQVWAVVGDFMNIDKFAPQITKVENIGDKEAGIGAKRRCHFQNGSAMAEEVTTWDEASYLKLKLSELDAMPLVKADADIRLETGSNGGTNVIWGMDFKVKFGPLGWLMGQLMMKPMMGKIIKANLEGLAKEVATA